MLQVKHVLESIYAVTLAITKNQDITEGFSCIRPEVVEAISQHISTPDKIEELNIQGILERVTDKMNGVIRFSRPLIVAVHFNAKIHTILLVIQYNDENKLQATVLDSRPWTLQPEGKLTDIIHMGTR